MSQELELRLIQTLRSHGQREGAALDSYKRLAENASDRAVHYLARLIVGDEERHYRVISEMSNLIESFIAEEAIEPSVPYLRKRVDPTVADETQRLLDFEKADLTELRRLREELRRAWMSSLLPLLVSLMIHDTAKHLEILRFVKAHTTRR